MKKIIQIIFFISVTAFAQELELVNKFGDFSNASSFDIDLKGNFFISDIDENTISKYDSTGEKIISIGGFGWKEAAFDEPTDLFTNTLSVYVADRNNNRIQRFDKDLNFLSQYPDNESDKPIFGYPACISISNLGFFFILDSDNFRILKYNLDGKFILEIGANNSGNFALIEPKYFCTDHNSNIYVIDNKTIKIFDQYGMGTFSFNVSQEPDKIFIYSNKLLLIYKKKIIEYNLNNHKQIYYFKDFPELNDKKITDAKLFDNSLFILTSEKLLKYKIIN
ncbi:MAG: hypothetical protein CR986_04535 [Ignavibacteriae bacterium]|nr:MAG: hypothetical protein CR986_04535 [Ignavibacteriota bacterium]